jgi:(heptosyl)LPS beta-1,4-glucosyltransferase
MKPTLAAIIIAGNEEANIGECLASLAGWCAEIVVVDSMSTDRTAEISRSFTPTVLQRAWTGFADQKQFALDHATSEWVLSIDADERASEELRDSIVKRLAENPAEAGFLIPRRSYFLGRWIQSCFWYPDYQLRLVRRRAASVIPVKVHEGFRVEGATGMLTGDIIHYSYRNLSDAVRKADNYTTLSAEERRGQKRIGARHLILHSAAAFLNDFISRKGYRDGIHGFLVAALNSFTNLLMYAKLWEQQNGASRGK